VKVVITKIWVCSDFVLLTILYFLFSWPPVRCPASADHYLRCPVSVDGIVFELLFWFRSCRECLQAMMKDLVTPVPVEEINLVVKTCLEKAALINYTKMSEVAKIEGQLCLRDV